MTYRKIEVVGKVYEYVTGKTHTKIKGLGIYSNADIGDRIDTRCECCGEWMKELRPNSDYTKLGVTPSGIRKVIVNSLNK